MLVDVGGAARELLMVLALAAAGLLLALLAAFTPWYGDPTDAGKAAVVELHAPPVPAASLATAIDAAGSADTP